MFTYSYTYGISDEHNYTYGVSNEHNRMIEFHLDKETKEFHAKIIDLSSKKVISELSEIDISVDMISTAKKTKELSLAREQNRDVQYFLDVSFVSFRLTDKISILQSLDPEKGRRVEITNSIGDFVVRLCFCDHRYRIRLKKC